MRSFAESIELMGDEDAFSRFCFIDYYLGGVVNSIRGSCSSCRFNVFRIGLSGFLADGTG